MLLTNDVVREVVFPHGLQQAAAIIRLASDETEHLEPVLLAPVFDAVLHHVASHLLLGKHEELIDAQSDNLATSLWSSLSNDGLHDVVAPVVRNQSVGNLVELLQDEGLVRRRSLLDHPLDHPAGVLLLRELEDSTADGVVNEVDTIARQLSEHLLHDVVSILALHDADDIGLKLFGQLDLLFDEHILESLRICLAGLPEESPSCLRTHLLNASAPVELRRKLGDVALHLRSKQLLLDHSSVLEELLHDVVAENIHHQGVGVYHDFLENALPVVAVRSWDLLLQKPGALLISSKLDDAPEHILETH